MEKKYHYKIDYEEKKNEPWKEYVEHIHVQKDFNDLKYEQACSSIIKKPNRNAELVIDLNDTSHNKDIIEGKSLLRPIRKYIYNDRYFKFMVEKSSYYHNKTKKENLKYFTPYGHTRKKIKYEDTDLSERINYIVNM